VSGYQNFYAAVSCFKRSNRPHISLESSYFFGCGAKLVEKEGVKEKSVIEAAEAEAAAQKIKDISMKMLPYIYAQ
jgi:hypothetical protein